MDGKRRDKAGNKSPELFRFDPQRLGIVGGTGRLGYSLARRWAKAGYAALHLSAPIWPEMEATLKAHGVHNYSIFLLEKTGQLFAYAEIDSGPQWAAIAATPECQEWWHHMADLMPHNAEHSPIADEPVRYFISISLAALRALWGTIVIRWPRDSSHLERGYSMPSKWIEPNPGVIDYEQILRLDGSAEIHRIQRITRLGCQRERESKDQIRCCPRCESRQLPLW